MFLRFNSDTATPVSTRNFTSKYYDKAQRDHHLTDNVFVSKSNQISDFDYSNDDGDAWKRKRLERLKVKEVNTTLIACLALLCPQISKQLIP